MGDSVVIRTRPSLQIRDYQIGGGLQYERPTSNATMLDINQGKYFAFEASDVDMYQSDLNLMSQFTDDATEQMQIVIDKDVLGNIYGSVSPQNSGDTAGADSNSIDLGKTGAPFALNKQNVTDKIVDLGTVLDEQNVPQTGRWLVLPPWACGMIKKSDLSNASIAGDGTSILRNGRIGEIDRFVIYNSNNLATGTDNTAKVTNIMAGHKAGLTFASQMTRMEELPNPDDFGRLVRGLNVYGYKVLEGKYLAHLYATQG